MLSSALRLSVLLPALLWLVACGSFGGHVVRKGETLYSISWRYGQDYRQLAQWNGIPPPYIIHEGQRLRLSPPPSGQKAATPATAAAPRTPDSSRPRPAENRGEASKGVVASRHKASSSSQRHPQWRWPARGKLISRFSPGDAGRKGIDIAGRAGQAVRAAAAGRVVYSGDGIPHYGNLLIIKHNDKYLSAYAHNRRLLVKEGEAVAAGQRIAEMGSSGTGVGRVMLHFEIRADGVPVDPLRYLPRK